MATNKKSNKTLDFFKLRPDGVGRTPNLVVNPAMRDSTIELGNECFDESSVFLGFDFFFSGHGHGTRFVFFPINQFPGGPMSGGTYFTLIVPVKAQDEIVRLSDVVSVFGEAM
jgi:hypothetical protein